MSDTTVFTPEQLWMPGFIANPYPTYRHLRDQSPLNYMFLPAGAVAGITEPLWAWALMKHDDVYNALRDHETFSSQHPFSRSERQRATTLEWLQRHHLSALVDEITFLGADTNNLAWCLSASVLFLIDDDLRHLEPADKFHAITRIHFCARPLQAPRTRKDILAAGSWRDVVSILMAARSARMPMTAGVRGNR